MAADPITAGLDLAGSIVSRIWPDKTQVEKDQLAKDLATLTAQTDIDKAEAQSSDPLQHWRGALGWVCAAGYAWNFVLQPLIMDISTVIGRQVILHPLDISQLSTLTLAMLGLGGLHVAERVKGVA